jgi:hypothetical protein
VQPRLAWNSKAFSLSAQQDTRFRAVPRTDGLRMRMPGPRGKGPLEADIPGSNTSPGTSYKTGASSSVFILSAKQVRAPVPGNTALGLADAAERTLQQSGLGLPGQKPQTPQELMAEGQGPAKPAHARSTYFFSPSKSKNDSKAGGAFILTPQARPDSKSQHQ